MSDKKINRVTLLFTGQGAQKKGICSELIDNPIAKNIDSIAVDVLGFSVIEKILSSDDQALKKTTLSQPVMFYIGYLTYELLKEYTNLYVISAAGHSLGEITALTASGVFSLKEAFWLVSQRARFMDLECQKQLGGMLAVIGDNPKKLAGIASGYNVYLANINSESQVVFSGELNSLNQFRGEVKNLGFRSIFLKVEGAFHSPYMEKASSKFYMVLREISTNPFSFPVVSNVKGEFHNLGDLKERLAQHLSSPVRWTDCMKTLLKMEPDMWIETCPGNVLIRFLPDSYPGKKYGIDSMKSINLIS